MALETKKVFTAKKREAVEYDTEKLAELTKQFKDDVDVILIKKPKKVKIGCFVV